MAANREDASYLALNLEAQYLGATVFPSMGNPTRRTVSAQAFLDVWAEGQPVDVGPFYRGEERTIMGPGDAWRGSLSLAKRGTPYPRLVSVRWWASWTDDLGERCESHRKHWTITFEGSTALIVARLGASEIERYFGKLPRLNIEKADADASTLGDGTGSLVTS